MNGNEPMGDESAVIKLHNPPVEILFIYIIYTPQIAENTVRRRSGNGQRRMTVNRDTETIGNGEKETKKATSICMGDNPTTHP